MIGFTITSLEETKNILLSLGKKKPTVYRCLKALGSPSYHALLTCYSGYVAKRFGWKFPRKVPPGFRIGFATGKWEPHTTSTIKRELFEGAVFVDVGANVGYYTKLASEITGRTGLVFAFEPEPENFVCLLQNAGRLPNVYSMPLALADEIGLRKLLISPLSGCHSLVIETAELDERKYIWVSTITFDHFVKLTELSRIDLIKIDAEGAEPLVLRGMEQTLHDKLIRSMIIEFNPSQIISGGSDPLVFARKLTTHFDVSVIEQEKCNLSNPRIDTSGQLEKLVQNLLMKGSDGVVNLFCRIQPV